jgi:enolase
MTIIKKIQAREILDSRGNPTLEVDVILRNGVLGRAAVPSGASTGVHEAFELRDYNKRFLGLGVKKAVNNAIKIGSWLKGMDCTKQRQIDNLMIRKDSTSNKHKLGANAILGISLACARAAANSKRQPLYKYLRSITKKSPKLPRLFLNVINGGKHADNKISFQEFMISPRFNNLAKNVQAASEVYHILKKDLHKKYGVGVTNVGDEGGFAPPQLKTTAEVLNILKKAINDAGYNNKIAIAIDCAASEFYHQGKYHLDGKKLTTEQLLQYYLKLIKKYPIISIEDPFHQDDFTSFANLTKKVNIQVVGDDLTVTNQNRINMAITHKSCNALLLKVNQIGTLSESIDAAQLAFKAGWKVMVSHRSGETEDSFIADLAVALGCGQIKAGAPCRGERTAKYNQLLRIEHKKTF